MKIEEFLEVSEKALKSGAEHAKTNFEEIFKFVEENTSEKDLVRLLSDLYQLGILMSNDINDHDSIGDTSVIMTTQCLIRNKKIIRTLFKSPEMEVEFD